MISLYLILTFQFLEGSNMTETNKQLITVTCPAFNFKNVTEAVERLYSHGNVEKVKQEEKVASVKHEPCSFFPALIYALNTTARG